MLTFLFFESYILSRWRRRVSIHLFWAKVISLVFPVLVPVGVADRRGRSSSRIRNSCSAAVDVDEPSSSSNSARTAPVLVMSIEETFQAAVKVIHSLPKDGPYQPSNGTKLKFYGLFKQATDGPCNIAKPAFYDIIGRYKWDAWNKLGKLGKEEAMVAYVDGLKDIIETMSFNGEVENFLDSIGPFYEFINLQGSKMNHIKEKVDQFTSSSSDSSSSSSNSNSIQTSPINSSSSSPVKSLQIPSSKTILEEEIINEDGEEQVHVQVEERSATFEAVVLKTSVQQNSNGHSQSESLSKSQRHSTPRTQDFDSNSIIPPPTPMHTYARTNGFLPNKHANNSSNSSFSKGITEDFDGEELIQLESNGDPSLGARCKEDLEQDPNDFEYRSHQTVTNHQGYEKLQNTASIDTLATSGTESEKYYSGDSEPEVDERFTTFYSQTNPANNSNGSPVAGCSKAVPYTQINGIPVSRTQLAVNSETDSKFQSKDRGVSSSFIKRSRSPKVNGGLNQFSPTTGYSNSKGSSSSSLDPAAAGELVIQSAVERLNRDVDHILARLRILETAYATTAEQGIAGQTRNGNRRKAFLGGLSKTSLLFIVMWPFIVHFIIRLLSWWWRRKRLTRVLTKALTR